jgi:hypothetical protein
MHGYIGYDLSMETIVILEIGQKSPYNGAGRGELLSDESNFHIARATDGLMGGIT